MKCSDLFQQALQVQTYHKQQSDNLSQEMTAKLAEESKLKTQAEEKT